MSRKDYYKDPNAPKANSIKPATTVIICDQEDRILLERRSDNGKWGIPGGVMEFGESISEAAIREVKEETGLDIAIDYLVGLYTSPDHIIEFPDGEIRQEFSVLFACKLLGGILQVSKESLELQWFSKDEVLSLDMTLSTRSRIEDYLTNSTRPYIKYIK